MKSDKHHQQEKMESLPVLDVSNIYFPKVVISFDYGYSAIIVGMCPSPEHENKMIFVILEYEPHIPRPSYHGCNQLPLDNTLLQHITRKYGEIHWLFPGCYYDGYAKDHKILSFVDVIHQDLDYFGRGSVAPHPDPQFIIEDFKDILEGRRLFISSQVSEQYYEKIGNDQIRIETSIHLCQYIHGREFEPSTYPCEDEENGENSESNEYTDPEDEDDESSDEETLDEETLDEETLDEETLDEETLDEETLDDGSLDDETLDEETLDEETLDDETLDDETLDDETDGDLSSI